MLEEGRGWGRVHHTPTLTDGLHWVEDMVGGLLLVLLLVLLNEHIQLLTLHPEVVLGAQVMLVGGRQWWREEGVAKRGPKEAPSSASPTKVRSIADSQESRTRGDRHLCQQRRERRGLQGELNLLHNHTPSCTSSHTPSCS